MEICFALISELDLFVVLLLQKIFVHVCLGNGDTYLLKSLPASRLYFLSFFLLFLLAGSPTVSGMSDMDYPLQGPGLLSIPNLPEISSVRRVPLPPELVEQFGRILM